MKFTRLDLTNWLAHRHLSMPFAAMTLVTGPNHCGKSSVGDAIAFAITGDLRRLTSKGDRGKLVSDGATKGAVTLVCQDTTVSRDIGTGKLSAAGRLPLPETAVIDAIPYALDRTLFAASSPDDRRKLLRDLVRADLDGATILATLQERGHPAALVDTLDVDGSLEDWIAKADRQATEGRGAWKSLAGENYGTEKAKTFVVPIPAWVDPDVDFPAMTAALNTLQHDADMLHRELGALDAAEADGSNHAAKVATLTRQAGRLPDAQATLEQADIDLTALQVKRGAADAKLKELQQRMEVEHLSCPGCGSLVRLHDGALHHHETQARPSSKKERDEAATAIQRLDVDIRAASRVRATAAQEVATCTAAAEAVETLAPAAATSASAPRANRADVERQLADALVAIKAKQAEHSRAGEGRMAVAAALERTAAAAEQHKTITGWLAIKAALAPTGIPGEILQRVLQPFNAYLRELSQGSGWVQPTIGQDMEIVVMGRPYALLSRSEKWRVDTMLTIAISVFGDLGFVLLDEFDLLDVPSRNPALTWLYRLTKAGTLDSVVIMATTKAPPQVPPAVTVHWLGPAVADAKAA